MKYPDKLDYYNRAFEKFATSYADGERCLLWNDKIIWTFLGHPKNKDGKINYSVETFEGKTQNGLGFSILAKGKENMDEMYKKMQIYRKTHKCDLNDIDVDFIKENTISHINENIIFRNEGICRGR